jgi:membrane peptidoglycan carboxypeptidase
MADDFYQMAESAALLFGVGQDISKYSIAQSEYNELLGRKKDLDTMYANKAITDAQYAEALKTLNADLQAALGSLVELDR